MIFVNYIPKNDYGNVKLVPEIGKSLLSIDQITKDPNTHVPCVYKSNGIESGEGEICTG